MMAAAAAVWIVPRMMISTQRRDKIALGAVRMCRLRPPLIERRDEVESQVDRDERLNDKRSNTKPSGDGDALASPQSHRRLPKGATDPGHSKTMGAARQASALGSLQLLPVAPIFFVAPAARHTHKLVIPKIRRDIRPGALRTRRHSQAPAKRSTTAPLPPLL